MDFLEKGYEVPVSGGRYYKLVQGENNFRIISSAIVGYEYWNLQDKPVRMKEFPKKKPVDIRPEKNGTWKVKHFWAFVVWSYENSDIEIMEVTQKTIMNAIKSLVDNAKWGNPADYDITITKSGNGLETTYAIMPSPKSELEPKIAEDVKKSKVNLQALFEGGNPFEEIDTHESTLSAEEQNDILNTIEVE